jgi:hypothetical protein
MALALRPVQNLSFFLSFFLNGAKCPAFRSCRQRCAVQLAAACGAIPHLDSLSHVFIMHCPVVQPAVVWLQDLWARLVPG